MSSSRTRSSSFHASQSAPSSSSMRDTERRTKGRRAKELTCESCGKVYKHPVCLQKHLWEHNPLWRDTAQLLLSKHQQVQVMEAAAILIHGQSLPPDRSLWPSYMSGGTLPSPTSATTPTPTAAAVAKSPSAASFRRATSPPASHFDDEELAGVSEEGEEEDEEEDEEDEEENGLTTDESDIVVPAEHGRARSQSVALPAPVQSHMPNLVGSYGSVGSHMLPASSSSFANAMPAANAPYGWGVIAAESGQHASFNGIGIYGPKSPVSESHASPRLPVTINQHPHLPHGHHHHQHHRSLSSFSSFTHSFGSSSTSSYIPSSSLRSSSDLNGQEEEEDEEMLLGGGGGGSTGDSYSRKGEEGVDEYDDEFDYNFQRATTLCRRLTAVSIHKSHHARGDSAASGASASSPSSNKSVSPGRRRDDEMYELEMDMD